MIQAQAELQQKCGAISYQLSNVKAQLHVRSRPAVTGNGDPVYNLEKAESALAQQQGKLLTLLLITVLYAPMSAL